jgi:large subunit ribosomal protein L24e
LLGVFDMKCSFCGAELTAGRGKMFVKNSGIVFYFCNSKCQKNYKLGRDGKNVKWTGRFAEFKGK